MSGGMVELPEVDPAAVDGAITAATDVAANQQITLTPLDS